MEQSLLMGGGGGGGKQKNEKKGWATKNLSVVVGKNQGSVIIYSQGGGHQYMTYLFCV
jgi:hypothetical protein